MVICCGRTTRKNITSLCENNDETRCHERLAPATDGNTNLVAISCLRRKTNKLSILRRDAKTNPPNKAEKNCSGRIRRQIPLTPPLASPWSETSGDRNQSDVTDVDIRWRIHLQLVSVEFLLTAGAGRIAVMLLRDSSIPPASEGCSTVTKHSQMTLSIVLLFLWCQTRWQRHIFIVQLKSESPFFIPGYSAQLIIKPMRMSKDALRANLNADLCFRCDFAVFYNLDAYFCLS